MALLDLSLVTAALVKLIQISVSSSEVWNGTGTRSDGEEVGEWATVPVSPIPADLIQAGPGAPATVQMSVNLYHVGEDAHFKNQPYPGPETAAVRYTPMGLNLHYQLCALAGEDGTQQYQAQRLMGLAVKALHDYPNLTDETRIAGVTIFEGLDLANNDNRIRLSLQPIPHNEAVSFWSAGSTPPRLSAYYLASVILLEPEQPSRRATRVLKYGTYPTTMGRPRLYASENIVTIEPPGTGLPQELRLRPAEVPLGGAENWVSFTGAGLAGDEVRLLLRSLRWMEPRQVDPAWSIGASDSFVRAAVQPLSDREEMLPGTYAASVQVVSLHILPDGQVRRLVQTSNETPFTITPYIESVDGPNADGLWTVRGRIFEHDELDARDLQVFVGAVRLTRAQSGNGDLHPGEFRVDSSNEIELHMPDDFTPDQHHPLRVIVSGAESAPRWIQVP